MKIKNGNIISINKIEGNLIIFINYYNNIINI